MDTIRSLILTMRPKQWTKNILFVFPAIIFSARLLELDSLIRVVVACILLILTSGCVYIINDLADLESDKLHPVKRTRPLAAGKLSPQAAKVAALVLPLLILYAAYSFDLQLTLVLLAYFALQIAYSLYVKHMVILDILAVAAGFVLRLVAGGVVIDVSVSPWLYVSVGLLALFLVIGKRRQELALLGDKAQITRPIFKQYSLPLLDDMLRIVTSATAITYILYTVEAQTMIRSGENLGLLTVPIVIYGLFRYLYLIHVEGQGSAPDEVLLGDRPLQLTLVVAAFSYFVILYVL